jgi:hypothetical protein
MPHVYPCKNQGTAVVEERVVEYEGENGEMLTDTSYPVDCEKTIEVNGCPFMNADPPKEGAVLGMFGTHCWYRGKYGNWVIGALKSETNDINETPDYYDGENSFYGTNAESTHRPANECVELADEMQSDLDERGGTLVFFNSENEADDRTADAKYAIWYLRWSAEYCDGMDAWF